MLSQDNTTKQTEKECYLGYLILLQLTCYFTDKNDILVHITIYNVPASLVKEFTQEVVRPSYLGGISDAIRDLMRKTVQEAKEKKQ